MDEIKSYTDLKQSKKLAKILPITSNDFAWCIFSDGSTKLLRMDDWEVSENAKSNVDIIPCFSLAALLSVLPSVIKRNGKRMFLTLEKACAYNLYYKSPDRLDELWVTKEEPIDACVAMIIKLYELNWL